MGYKIAITGLIVFLTTAFMTSVAKRPPENRDQFIFFGLIMLIGMFAILFGLIIQVWI